MALAKDRTIESSIYGGGGGGGGGLASSAQGLDSPSHGLFGYKGHNPNSLMVEEGEALESLRNYSGSLLPMLSDPANMASTSYGFGATLGSMQASASRDLHWVYNSNSSPLLSFAQNNGDFHQHNGDSNYAGIENEDECAWIDSMDSNYNQNSLELKRSSSDSWLIPDENCYEITSGYAVSNGASKEKHVGEHDHRFGLVYNHGATMVDGLNEGVGQGKSTLKRAHKDGNDNVPSPKKQCGNSRKTKEKSSPSKDPQSLAAKNRRERISERLKILQDLVPNGTKVDLVTMLEKAISYVKFLQLQVKVLATDEFWPAQGGKAPELSQVKDAIDAILSSNRERSSSSSQ